MANAENLEVLGQLAGASCRNKLVNSRGCGEIDPRASILGFVLTVTAGMSPCDPPAAVLAGETSSSDSLPLVLQCALLESLQQ